MKLVYFSNFIDHHMAPVADELYRLTNGGFRYVEVTPMPDSFRACGYPDFSSRPYLIQYWKDNESEQLGNELLFSAEVAIFNSEFVLNLQVKRVKAGLFSFEMSERWLKRGIINLLSPRLLRNMWYYHTIFCKQPLYKLCSGAFVAQDQQKLFSYKNKCYKWGYFTTIDENLESIITHEKQYTTPIKFMWCARYLNWKHPEMPIRMAETMKKKGYDIVLDMYGTGIELERTKQLAIKLGVNDIVNFYRNRPNEEILINMHNHDIFLCTSDRQEGWGAVVSEAMSNGCIVVGSNEAGCVPYLIEDGKNGMIFISEDQASLNSKVEWLLNNPAKLNELSIESYKTMRDIWSPANAANSFLWLIDDLKNGRESSIKKGPCSKDNGNNANRL